MSDDDSNLQRAERIETNLRLCDTFIVMAASKFEHGDLESAERSLSNAENIYATIVPLLADPKHLNAEQIQTFTAELERLRERLDRLRPVRKVRTAR
jgi:hypothetical protein